MQLTTRTSRWRVAPLLNWTRAYEAWLRTEYVKRGGGELSHHTLAALLQDLRHLARWHAQECGHPFDPSDLTLELVHRYFEAQERHDDKPKTRNRRLASLRTLVKWCLELGLLQSDPTRRQRFAQERRLPRQAKSDDEMRALEAVAVLGSHLGSPNPFLRERDQIIWMLFKNLTLRIDSVAKLRWRDIKGRTLTVVTKGDVEWEFPINDELAAALDHWRSIHAGRGAGVVTDRSGRNLTTGQIRRRLYAMASVAGVSVKPHDLRHTRILRVHAQASKMMSPGEALDVTATLAGHMDRRTTLGYLRASAEALVLVNNQAGGFPT